MKTFEELDLIRPLQRALAELGYKTPTPIQAQATPPALEGQDVLGCAQTGTGKTAAFALPILDILGREKPKAQPRRPMALVLAPTRELAVQIGASFADYGKHIP
ncbi:MAG: DEAD/DEAH box helicase, partial [Planctomycetales bacterium]|nr:DEAD/DEAH box helicase [Planctomycetales bacterium]